MLPATGHTHRYQLDPRQGRVQAHVRQASIPLVMLPGKALGAADKRQRKASGLALRESSAKHDTPAAFDKLHSRFVRQGVPGADQQTRRQELKASIEAMPIDPEASQQTLGHPQANLGLGAEPQRLGAGSSLRWLAWDARRARVEGYWPSMHTGDQGPALAGQSNAPWAG